MESGNPAIWKSGNPKIKHKTQNTTEHELRARQHAPHEASSLWLVSAEAFLELQSTPFLQARGLAAT